MDVFRRNPPLPNPYEKCGSLFSDIAAYSIARLMMWRWARKRA